MCQRAEEPDPLSLGRNCDKRPDAGYGRCQPAFPEAHSTCPLYLTPENHLADCTTPFGPNTTVSFLHVHSENLPPGALSHDGCLLTLLGVPWRGPQHRPQKGRRGEEAATEGTGASALAWLPEQPRGLGDPAEPGGPTGAVAPARQAALTQRRDHRADVSKAGFCFCATRFRVQADQGEGGSKPDTQPLTHYKLLSPPRSHRISPLSFLSEQNSSSLYFGARILWKPTRGEGECWAAGLGMDPKQCAEAGHCDQRNSSVKWMRRVIATHQA